MVRGFMHSGHLQQQQRHRSACQGPGLALLCSTPHSAHTQRAACQ
jgi:hypothetical protein